MDTFLLILQALVVVGAIYMGVRLGGVGLGLWGAVGVLVLVFVFGAPPGEIPSDAILVIIAVITAASAMQAAGGIDYLVHLAEKVIRSRPRLVNYLAPLITFAFCAGSGTGNIIFPLLPVIYEVSYERGIRPERPLATSVAVSGFALAASPVAAAMAAFVGLTGDEDGALSLGEILLITFPAVLLGTIVAAVVQSRVGRDLADDPEFQRRLAAGLIEPPASETGEDKGADVPATAKRAAGVFFAGVLAVVLLGAFDELLPTYEVDGTTETLSLTTLLIMVMLVVALAVMAVGKVRPGAVLDAPLTKSGLTAIIALLGIAWLANTFITGNEDTVIGGLTDIAEEAPWFLAIGLFLVAAATTSQSASVNTMIPLGISLGVPVATLAAYLPAMGGVMTLPANGSQLAAVEIDQTGSTTIGRYVLNHSFILPTLVIAVVSVPTALLISRLFV
ncbi:anaerobic C4-dicarboxylate transporter [Mumia sp. zg.B53]|uniref:anaerobic C4-dicarboxylate transporter family protein n=1 Tax=unclassified Mumia TaxID=2621872 RepID=UPI001C6F5A9A|nr:MULTISPECIES: anaerobic C4-dicarboxylate transporter family protein [unclassified Mumia]MBW9207100.1 anaerobic C4-dicarboxylate transporter [Mumia sp. zg.B17]MBW9210564.1 anaerobic C4-dicarboxylate transporter [Mumia sp. zg.B21]MBW9215177.1 anaerobic C4-dicarboxylate transporter [Mumia sp. zg.B53]MDD9347599.1 anaerobic C4-dicarboxylate transporter family protein [Mumia sp.]